MATPQDWQAVDQNPPTWREPAAVYRTTETDSVDFGRSSFAGLPLSRQMSAPKIHEAVQSGPFHRKPPLNFQQPALYRNQRDSFQRGSRLVSPERVQHGRTGHSLSRPVVPSWAPRLADDLPGAFPTRPQPTHDPDSLAANRSERVQLGQNTSLPATDGRTTIPASAPGSATALSSTTNPNSNGTHSNGSNANESKAISSGASKRAFKLASRPQAGEHLRYEEPEIDCRASHAPYFESDFLPDPISEGLPYDECAEIDIYQGKSLNRHQRPLLELGRPYYFLGEQPESYTFLGETNLAAPRFLVYGDYRTAIAHNRQNGNSQSVWAHRLNLDLDLKLTGTERFHAFMGPLDRNNRFTRGVYDNGQFQFISELDAELDTVFFEGDLGAIVGGIGNQVLPFELPIALGLMPLLFQNGIWFEDAIAGAAVTLPAMSSPVLDISNYDITFFAGFDQVSSPAFGLDDNAAKLYGGTTFLEALNGYLEIGYAYLDDRQAFNRSYHNVGISYTRRHAAFVSSSYRVIANFGQKTVGIDRSADGALLLWENSLITSSPYNVVPYWNLFAGLGRPQSAARAANAGGILRNTGILFETDALTGYPTLDDTGNDTIGGAVGLNLLSSSFDQQLVIEAAVVNPLGSDVNRVARGHQYGFGFRYQIPISHAALIRCDGMYGILKGDDDVSGLRVEFRHKF